MSGGNLPLFIQMPSFQLISNDLSSYIIFDSGIAFETSKQDT